MISVWFFHVFILNNWEKFPGGGVLARFYRPQGWGFWTPFLPGGWGIRPSKKLPGGMVRLGTDWYIIVTVFPHLTSTDNTVITHYSIPKESKLWFLFWIKFRWHFERILGFYVKAYCFSGFKETLRWLRTLAYVESISSDTKREFNNKCVASWYFTHLIRHLILR